MCMKMRKAVDLLACLPLTNSSSSRAGTCSKGKYRALASRLWLAAKLAKPTCFGLLSPKLGKPTPEKHCKGPAH